MTATPPLLAITQGDPAGVGPELLLRLVASPPGAGDWRPLLIAERAALEAAPPPEETPELRYFDRFPESGELDRLPPGTVPVLDPVGEPRAVTPGRSGAADAAGAMAALDAGIRLARRRAVDALVTAPVSKESIARHHDSSFRGHTDHLARACGLRQYGRDYLMAFLSPDLQVALLTTHLPLRQAIEVVDSRRVVDALRCLDRAAGGRVAVAGLNPHAGEGGLMGTEERAILEPAVAEARRHGVDAYGPESPDSLFARARSGEFDWVLALYHDQGLIAVKTAAFGLATNWTVGLPFVRTSVDHGTAFEIAGRGVADPGPLARVVATTLELLAGRLPRRGQAARG